MTGKRKTCLFCFNRTANVWLFKQRMNEGDVSHIDRRFPMCSTCATVKVNENKNEFLGYLPSVTADQYEKSCKEDLIDVLHREGAIVTRLPTNIMQQIVHAIFYPRLVRQAKASNELNHSPYVASKKSQQYHPHRRWNNIFDLSDTNNTNSAFLNACAPLVTFLSQTLYPHENYALVAKKHFANSDTGTVTQYNRREEIQRAKDYDPVLSIENVNVLIKGKDLLEQQSFHVDGLGLKLVLVYVDECSDSGYNFHFIPGSHNLLCHHGVCSQENRLPASVAKKLTAKQNECIIFFQSVIHGGGASSGGATSKAASKNSDGSNCTGFILQKKRRKWISDDTANKLERFRWFADQTMPTDISFQISFQYGANPGSYILPNRTNTWYERTDIIDSNEHCQICRQQLLTSKSEECSFFRCGCVVHRSCCNQHQPGTFVPNCKSAHSREIDNIDAFLLKMEESKECFSTKLKEGLVNYIQHMCEKKRIQATRSWSRHECE
eukprot:scaffold1660_cov170-Skeletonema_dohrnii-CCMP3373.AAC.1